MVKIISTRGPLMGGGGGSQCRMSILRNVNVAYLSSMSFTFPSVTCRIYETAMSHVANFILVILPSMSLCPMSHVEFKKCSCRPFGFRGQGPSTDHVRMEILPYT